MDILINNERYTVSQPNEDGFAALFTEVMPRTVQAGTTAETDAGAALLRLSSRLNFRLFFKEVPALPAEEQLAGQRPDAPVTATPTAVETPPVAAATIAAEPAPQETATPVSVEPAASTADSSTGRKAR